MGGVHAEGEGASDVIVERRQLFWQRVPDRMIGATLFACLDTASAAVEAAAAREIEAMVGEHFVRERQRKTLSEAERIGQEVGASKRTHAHPPPPSPPPSPPPARYERLPRPLPSPSSRPLLCPFRSPPSLPPPFIPVGGVLKPGSLTFLDQRRFNNLAIALTKLGLPNEEIRRAVLAADESVLTPDVLALVSIVAPTADDVEAIAPYDGDPVLLAQVERFFYEVRHDALPPPRIRNDAPLPSAWSGASSLLLSRRYDDIP